MIQVGDHDYLCIKRALALVDPPALDTLRPIGQGCPPLGSPNREQREFVGVVDSERSGATWFPADRVGHAWEDVEPSGWERRIDWSRRAELVYGLSEDTAAEVNEQERER